ncbi:Slam-dependent surface lipoprotein [Novosphingobium resinovorum]|uniref:Slam-dependent surface lipoprotein n=1 Tax=Novosphingobium resinovorum TaxID=158500 RepID=UPI002ED0EED2|nr:Slam-dependent surface lipoprotein [Novosphingobium resinovorum]
MKFVHLKAVVGAMALSVALAGTAQAQITSATSDSAKVQIGESNVVGGPHTAGKVGIWVPALPTTPTRLFVDFQGLQGTATPTANIVTTVNNPTGTITDHSQYGRFDFSKVDGYTVYYGEWSQTGSASAGDHTVYFGGTGASTDAAVNGLTGTAVNYNVYGLSNYAGNGQLNGTLTANFVADTLTGSIQSGNYKVDIGTADIIGSTIDGIDAEAFTVSGGVPTSVATNGVVSGQFFGSAAQALAGIVEFSNRQYDTAFGGKQ